MDRTGLLWDKDCVIHHVLNYQVLTGHDFIGGQVQVQVLVIFTSC